MDCNESTPKEDLTYSREFKRRLNIRLDEANAAAKINLKAEAETMSLDSQVIGESERLQQAQLLSAVRERFYAFYKKLPNPREVEPIFNEIKKNITFKAEEFLVGNRLMEVFEGIVKKQNSATRLSRKNWSEDETFLLISLMAYFCHTHNEDYCSLSEEGWKGLASIFPGKKADAIRIRWTSLLKINLSKAPWTAKEDEVLKELLKDGIGDRAWRDIAAEVNKYCPASIVRTGKQCRERWANHLDPSINRGGWNDKQDLELLKIFLVTGKKWSEIAKLIENRTENAIKNRYNSIMKKFKADVMFSNLRLGPTPEEEAIWEQRIAYMVLHSKGINVQAEIEKLKASASNLSNLDSQHSSDSNALSTESEAFSEKRGTRTDFTGGSKIGRRPRSRNKTLSNGSVNALLANHSRSNSNSSFDSEPRSSTKYGSFGNSDLSYNESSHRRVHSMSRVGSSEQEITKKKNLLKDIVQQEQSNSFTNPHSNVDNRTNEGLASILRHSNLSHGSYSPNSHNLHRGGFGHNQQTTTTTPPNNSILQQFQQFSLGSNANLTDNQLQSGLFNASSTGIGQNPINLGNFYLSQSNQPFSQTLVQNQLNSMYYNQNVSPQNNLGTHSNLYGQIPFNLLGNSNNAYSPNSQNILNNAPFNVGDKGSPATLLKNSNNPFYKSVHQSTTLEAIKENVVEENPQTVDTQNGNMIVEQQHLQNNGNDVKYHQLKEKSATELNPEALVQKSSGKLFLAVVDLESNDLYLMNNITKDNYQQYFSSGKKTTQQPPQQQGRDPLYTSPIFNNSGSQLDVYSPHLLQHLMEMDNMNRLNGEFMGLISKRPTEGSPLLNYVPISGQKPAIGGSPDSLSNLKSPNLFAALTRESVNSISQMWNASPGLRNEFSPNAMLSKYS